MRRRFHLLVSACTAAIAMAAPAWSAEPTVVSWGGVFQDAQRQVYFEPFQRATGIKLREDSWNGGIGVLRAKVAAGDGAWDLVQVEPEEQVAGCNEGLLKPLDLSRIAPKTDLVPSAVQECGLAANVYSFGIAYDAGKDSVAPRSWADFWDTTHFPGKRGLRRGPKITLEAALMADGVAPGDVYRVLRTRAGVDRAFAKLDALKPFIVWWTSGNQPMQLLASGEVAMTSTYNGRVSAARDTDRENFKFVWPGAILMVDSWVLLNTSRNDDAIYRFLKFYAAPENEAKFPKLLHYGVPNLAANRAVPEEIRADLPTAPENLAIELPFDAEFWVENVAALNDRFESWTAR